MWSTASHASPYDERWTTSSGKYSNPASHHPSSRSNYAYQGSSTGSSSSSVGYSSSSIDRPSPSSSATSASSLRTPPDLLINGATLATTLTIPPGKGLSLSKQRDFSEVHSLKSRRYMTIAQLESRLKILARATQSAIMNDALPSPPSSPAPKASPKKRQASDVTPDTPPEAQRARYDASTSSDRHLPLPRVRDWTKEQYFDTAVAYRHRGRELKHRGDRRLRESSAQISSPINEALVASLEQTDALLLYTYGFWCEDQGSATCVAANWHSIYALLRYVYLRYEKTKMNTLSGLCRLLEASILRHVSAHEMRMLHHRMGKASSAEHPSRSELGELSSQMTKVVGDQERSARLFAQSRQSVLNMSNLQQHYPRLAEFCLSSMQSSAWMTTDPVDLATRLDPSLSVAHAAATSTNGWSWPLDSSSPFPMLVCFGRALLREAAREANVDFSTDPVATSPASSSAPR